MLVKLSRLMQFSYTRVSVNPKNLVLLVGFLVVTGLPLTYRYFQENSEALVGSRISSMSFIHLSVFAITQLVLSISLIQLVKLGKKYLFSFDYRKNSLVSRPWFVIVVLAFLPNIISLWYFDSVSSYFKKIYLIGHLPPNFGDLRGVLVGSSRLNTVGIQIPCQMNECVPTTWIYGRMLLFLPNINYSNIQITLIAVAITSIFFLQLNSLLPTRSVLSAALFATAPIVLLFERQNLEIIVVSLVLLSAHLYSKQQYLLGAIFIIIASFIKFFPIILLPFFFRRQPIAKYIVLSCLSLSAVILVYQDFMKIHGEVSPGPIATYGFRNLLGVAVFDYEGSSFMLSCLALMWCVLVIAAFFYLVLVGFGFSQQHNTIDNKLQKISFIFTSIIFVTTSIVNSNYSYRLIWLVISIVLIRQIFVSRQLMYIAYTLYFVFSSTLTSIFYLQRNLSVFLLTAIFMGLLLGMTRDLKLTTKVKLN